MVKYSIGKIYMIRAYNGDKCDVYIGSTTKKYLSQRMDEHRSHYKSWKKGTRSKTSSYEIFEKYGIENCYITLLESFPCETKDELKARERYYIEKNDCVNKYIPGRSTQEWKESNKEALSEYKSKYYETNKDKLRDDNKKYRSVNKEKLSEANKIYKMKNKLIVKARRGVKHNCDCGGRYTLLNKTKHWQSKKHQKWKQDEIEKLTKSFKDHLMFKAKNDELLNK